MTTLLIYGSKGQLGWELIRTFRAQGLPAMGLDLPDHDLSDADRVYATIHDEKPALVINAAAFTAVDQAETRKDEAFKVNRDGPSNLARACASAGIPLIHVSTDYVFDGQSTRPYREDDPVCPLGVYGQSKEQGEREVRKWTDRHIIIRTAWVYGVHGQNFVKTMLKVGKENALVRVVNDQFGCPTSAADLADAIALVVNRIRGKGRVAWGTYHFCGSGMTSWYGFAEKVFELSGRRIPLALKDLRPISTAEYPTPARRPAYSVLDCDKINEYFGVTAPPWQASLEKTIEALLKVA